MLGVLAGKGLGPIRFGVTLATIERHMQAPCTEKVEGAAPGELVCRYGPQAVEFFLREGVLERLWVHGRNRMFSKKDDALYGLFRGGFESGARLGMLPEAVQEYVGKPESVRPAPADHPYGAEEIHTYRGMVLGAASALRDLLHPLQPNRLPSLFAPGSPRHRGLPAPAGPCGSVATRSRPWVAEPRPGANAVANLLHPLQPNRMPLLFAPWALAIAAFPGSSSRPGRRHRGLPQAARPCGSVARGGRLRIVEPRPGRTR